VTAVTSPVEFDPLSATFFDDPYPTYRRLRDEAPAYHNEQYGFWALSRHEDVLAAHRDWQTFSSTHGLTLDQLHSGEVPANLRSMIMQDPPEHDRMRKLVSRVFSPKAVAELEPMARAVIVGFLDDALADGQGAFDAVAQFSAPFPVEVISTMLGVPEGDRQQIRHWTDALLHREPGVAEMTKEGMEAGLNMGMYLYGLAEEKRVRPDDSMLCQLTQVEVARDDDGTMTRLTNEEIAGFATLLAGAGSETVTKLVGGGMVLFARNPSEWQKVLDDPVRINDATEEILRFWPPSQYQGRYSMRDSEWHGETIPAGTPVLLLTGAATHDERAFPKPDRFDIDRPHQLNVGFGHGIHLCLGAFLARMESRIAFEELRERVPNFEIDEDGLRRVHMSNVAGYSNVPVRAV
jgi:cytochrome P450